MIETVEEAIKCLESELRAWDSECKSNHPVKDALKNGN